MSYGIREVAERANLPEGFVRQLVAAGALPPEEGGLGPREVRRARLLHSWAAAGLSVETIIALVDQGALSLAFLDAPVMARPERLDHSYQQLAADHGVPLAFLQAVHQALASTSGPSTPSTTWMRRWRAQGCTSGCRSHRRSASWTSPATPS